MSYISPEQTVLKDGPQISAFGQLNVTSSYTQFDSQQEYGLDTRTTWDATAFGTLSAPSSNGSAVNGGNAVGPTDANTRLTPITVTSTLTHYSILQSRQYVRYIPGKGHKTFLTGIFAAGDTAQVALNLRTSTSGSAVTTSVAQEDWNQDQFDGTGASGITLDFTKVQILVIDAQMLYAGRVRIGFDVDGILHWAHYFEVANNQAVPTMQTYNLPVRMEGRTSSTLTTFNSGYFDSANGIFLSTTRSTKGGTIYFLCCSVQSDGTEELRGFPHSAPTGIVTTAVTTRRPVLSIRPKATYNSRNNRAHIEALEFELHVTTNDSFYEIVIGGTLTGASFTSVDANSVAEFDTTATAISGGTAVHRGFAISGAGSKASLSQGQSDLRNPLIISLIDALAATQTVVSLVCTSFSGTSNVTPVCNWHEQTN